MDWWRALIGFGTGLVLVWLGLLGALWVAQRRSPDTPGLRDALRLLPEVVRLLRRLVRDPGLPRGIRVRLWLLLGYLVLPIDLVPDFIPVLGYADDAILVALVLRGVVRRAGPEALAAHWSGTREGLAVVHRLAGLSPPA